MLILQAANAQYSPVKIRVQGDIDVVEEFDYATYFFVSR